MKSLKTTFLIISTDVASKDILQSLPLSFLIVILASLMHLCRLEKDLTSDNYLPEHALFYFTCFGSNNQDYNKTEKFERFWNSSDVIMRDA